MAAKTRLGFEGYGVRRAGAFSGKTGPALELSINPKWLRSALPRKFTVSAQLRNFSVQGKPA